MKTLTICVFGLQLALTTLARPSPFLESLGDLSYDAVSTGNNITEKFCTWINAHISELQTDADPLIVKINQTFLEYAHTLKNMEKDKQKMHDSFKEKIENSSHKTIQDISNLTDTLEQGDQTKECMDDILEVKTSTLNEINECETSRTAKGHNILLKLNQAQETLTEKVLVPIRYLENCNKNVALPQIPECNERKINLFVEDLKVITGDLQAANAKAAIELAETGEDARICMEGVVDVNSALILEYSDCSYKQEN